MTAGRVNDAQNTCTAGADARSAGRSAEARRRPHFGVQRSSPEAHPRHRRRRGKKKTRTSETYQKKNKRDRRQPLRADATPHPHLSRRPKRANAFPHLAHHTGHPQGRTTTPPPEAALRGRTRARAAFGTGQNGKKPRGGQGKEKHGGARERKHGRAWLSRAHKKRHEMVG